MAFDNSLKYDIKFFGWYNDPSVNSDKIWGWVELEGKLYNFWGRRDSDGDGKSLKFKRHESNWSGRHDLQALVRGKERKGYRGQPLVKNEEGNYPEIDKIYPNFAAHMKKQLMFARLTGTVKNEAV
jgi:predicted DNA-binding WGR domain protein